MADPLDPGHLMAHVQDAEYFEVPRAFAEGGKLYVPQLRPSTEPIVDLTTGVELIDNMIDPFNLRITKFMVLEVVAAVLVAVIFIWLAQKASSGDRPRGKLWNMFEAMLLFLRDDVARPAIGKHDADTFLPFLWTLFFFILACNLLGMVPWAGSPTGSIAATGALAVVTFLVVVGAGMKKLGAVHFWQAQVPHMDLPVVLTVFLKPMIFVIEILGLLIRHFVLAVRLLANMMAGHLVLAVLLAFIAVVAAASSSLIMFWSVAAASILGAAALGLLELFVAFLQAYIFTFLAALFIGMAVHPH